GTAWKASLPAVLGKTRRTDDRGDRGNVGIIRSPIRASILPDLIRHGWKNQHANILSSFGTICISWISRPTVEWKDTDYGVMGDGVPVAGYRLQPETNLHTLLV
ncbi:hypothetical protein, partial [Bradyrhizobium sp.]|uniref:hypothetical protein n=1 Tax=Bradyrhizobium sp. TaxID=376 RepID=UPI003BB11496